MDSKRIAEVERELQEGKLVVEYLPRERAYLVAHLDSEGSIMVDEDTVREGYARLTGKRVWWAWNKAPAGLRVIVATIAVARLERMAARNALPAGA